MPEKIKVAWYLKNRPALLAAISIVMSTIMKKKSKDLYSYFPFVRFSFGFILFLCRSNIIIFSNNFFLFSSLYLLAQTNCEKGRAVVCVGVSRGS